MMAAAKLFHMMAAAAKLHDPFQLSKPYTLKTLAPHSSAYTALLFIRTYRD
jgi:hypothetical protein